MTVATTDDNVVSGQVTGPLGEPVSGATVKIYPFKAGAGAQPLETQTDDAGQYTFESLADDAKLNQYIINPAETVVIVQYNDWFSTISGDLEPYIGSSFDIILEDQLLFEPRVARSGRSEETPESLVLVWRKVIDPGRQTLYLEVTNVRDHYAQEPYEIMSDTGDLVTGTFSVTMSRESATVNFGPQSAFPDETAPPVIVFARPNQLENPELEHWHPLRTGLPMFGIGGGNIKISGTDFDEVEDIETINEGVGRIARGLPVLGTVLTVADAIRFGVETLLEREASVGELDVGFPDPRDQNQLVGVPDPNTHTLVYQAWHLPSEAVGGIRQHAGSVAMQTPLQFAEGVNTLRVTARAEWMHPFAHVTFGDVFEISRVDTPIDNESKSSSGEPVLSVSLSPASVPAGEQTDVRVTVTDAEGPADRNFVPHIRVEIPELGLSAITSEDGHATLSVSTSDPGEYKVLAKGSEDSDLGDATAVLTVEPEIDGQHESRVSQELFEAVDEDGDSELSRRDIRSLVEGFVRDGELDGVAVERTDVRSLVEYFIRQ